MNRRSLIKSLFVLPAVVNKKHSSIKPKPDIFRARNHLGETVMVVNEDGLFLINEKVKNLNDYDVSPSKDYASFIVAPTGNNILLDQPAP